MKQILVILTVALLTIGIIITAFGFQNPVSQMNNNFYDYDKSWSEVDSLEKIRQVQTAQKKVEEIYTQAKKDKNDQQIVKSVFYKARYQTYGSDDAYNSMVNLYKKELEVANPTTKAIFHSLLGTFYSKYLDNNRWKLRNVTTTDKKPNPDDIETWSAKDLTAAAFEHFKASIQNKELADLPIEDFEILIKKGENKMLRPTLFDVLGHRALDFFTLLWADANMTQVQYEALDTTTWDFIQQMCPPSKTIPEFQDLAWYISFRYRSISRPNPYIWYGLLLVLIAIVPWMRKLWYPIMMAGGLLFYHAVVSAVAINVQPRYVVVTNPFKIILVVSLIVLLIQQISILVRNRLSKSEIDAEALNS